MADFNGPVLLRETKQDSCAGWMASSLQWDLKLLPAPQFQAGGAGNRQQQGFQTANLEAVEGIGSAVAAPEAQPSDESAAAESFLVAGSMSQGLRNPVNEDAPGGFSGMMMDRGMFGGGPQSNGSPFGENGPAGGQRPMGRGGPGGGGFGGRGGPGGGGPGGMDPERLAAMRERMRQCVRTARVLATADAEGSSR